MHHVVLVTRQRLYNLTPAATAICSYCDDQTDEDVRHAFIECSFNNGVGQSVLQTVQTYIPAMTAASLLRLELANLEDATEYSLATFVSASLLAIWDKRHSKSRITPFDTRTTLEARCLLLRKTRFSNQATILLEMINAM